MKKLILLYLLLPVLSLSQEMIQEAQDYKDIVMKYANDYLTPLQIDILENYYCGPECYTTRVNGSIVPWDKESSDIVVLGEINTIVHESTHHFNKSASRGSMNFVISENRFISVPKTETFKSNLIVNDMLKRNPNVKDMFRFDTYVNTNRNMCSSENGIYGLMNEYCAYYNGALSALILYEAFKEKHAENEEDVNYFNATTEEKFFRDIEKDLAISVMSSVSAFYQFNSFIGAYLIYAKENHYDMYIDILNNSLLVDAYSTITFNFNAIAKKTHEYFPKNNFTIVSETGSARITYGNNDILLLSQQIYNDYIGVLNKFINSHNLLLTKK